MAAAVADAPPGVDAEGDKKTKEKPLPEPAVPFSQLYSYCSTLEVTLLVTAAAMSLFAGICQPMMLVAFTWMFDGLGAATMLPGADIGMGLGYDLLYLMLGIGGAMGIFNFLSISITEYVVASQMRKYKVAYLKAVLRQDVGWYDVSNPEELSTIFAEAVGKVQKGLKAQNMFFMGLGYGGGAGVMAFLPQLGDWTVALVTLLTLPILAIAATMMMVFATGGDKTVAKAYAQAGGIATESLFSMRTIVSLGIENDFATRYSASLAKVRKAAVFNVAALYFSGGLTMSAYLIMMAVAIVFGSFRLAHDMDASAFDMIVPTNIGGSTVDVHYCIDSMGQLSNFSLTPCANPMQMTCSSATFMEMLGATPLARIFEMQNEPPPPPEYANATYLQALGFADMTAFDSYVRGSRAPADYLAGQAGGWPFGNTGTEDYYGCCISATKTVIAIFAIMMMGEGMGMIEPPAASIMMARQAAWKVFAIINRVPAIDSFAEDGAKPASVTGAINVENVVFSYPSSPDALVCKDYNLSIPAGETVALCGPSGSGKSTIIQLLERFYDPQSGTITLDGIDIKTLNVRWLRSQLGYVGQEPVLFQGTVAQNIGYGKQGTATQAEIEEAARMANAHDFIMTILSDGYQTDVGQGGSKLSGGQKQRVAIARAMIKQPAILLLDEATSALDTKSEKVVQAALDEIMTKQKRTTVVVAHRLSTIRNADKIAVLKEGAVVEQGTYDNLMTINDGLFRQLAQKQEELLAMDKAAVAGGSAHGGSEAAEEEVVTVMAHAVGAEESDGKKKKKEPKPKEESAPIGRLFALQADQAGNLAVLFVFAGAACFLSTVSFEKLAEVLEVGFEPLSTVMRSRATDLSIQMLIFAAVIIGCFLTAGISNGLAGSSLTAKLRSRGLAAIFRQEMGYFDVPENSAAELTAFLSEKTAKVKTITTEQLDLVSQLIGGFGGFLYVIIRQMVIGTFPWQLLLAWIAFIAVICAVMPLQMAFMTGEDAGEEKKKKGLEDNTKIGKATESANKIVGDAVLGIRTVASFNLEHKFLEDYASKATLVSNVQKKDALGAGFGMGITQVVMMGGFGAVFMYSVYMLNLGLVDMAGFMTPMFCMMGIMVPMMKAGALADLKNASNSAIRYFALLDRIPAIDNLSTEGSELPSVTGTIEVSDVVFSYPTAPEHLVCKGYSLSIPAGETLALCGPSGSGKSTIILLLERFYDPQSGTITLDGTDIKTLNVRWLRSQLGYVGQEPVLFQGTVAQNIAYGKQGTATQAEIEEAARMSNAHGFITETLGDGYKTDVGLKGGKLSGGQKQRVAIARAMIRQPKILLLDEATSALDNESERIVQAALDEIMTKQKRTTIVIAHRLSTIRNANKIAVVNEGAIAETGTHDDLLAKGGMYQSLVMSS